MLPAAGKLYTVFSAPEYPQFVGDEEERTHNRAAVAVLSAPDYAKPRMVQFEADLPRPEVGRTGGLGPGNFEAQLMGGPAVML